LKKVVETTFYFRFSLNIFGIHRISMKYLFSVALTLMVFVGFAQTVPSQFVKQEAFTLSRESQKLSSFQEITLPSDLVSKLIELPQGQIDGSELIAFIQPQEHFQSFRVSGTDVVITVQNNSRLQRMYAHSQKKSSVKK
jgi:hypothetical protein